MSETLTLAAAPPRKFADPTRTAKGEARASVALDQLETLWLNTGTLCNITCAHCYIESSPSNDRLAYLSEADVAPIVADIARLRLPVHEIGFTGGEPYLNPVMNALTGMALAAGFQVLVLTNAMRPMMRPKVQDALARLIAGYPEKLTFRVSLDHHDPARHDEERGPGAFAESLLGLKWLAAQGARLAVAGRTRWGDTDAAMRAGFAALFAREGLAIDAGDPGALVLFPEMDETADVPEITTACWDILHVRPETMMCATSRMVVKHKGADAVTVVPCTLLPYGEAFALGPDLETALAKDGGRIHLNHPHCAKFCVLGGGSCSA